jgi:hypothetical protein
VAAHGGKDERLRACLAQLIDHDADDLLQPRDAAAAHADRDAGAGFEAWAQLAEFVGDGRGYIEPQRSRKFLAHLDQARKRTGSVGHQR